MNNNTTLSITTTLLTIALASTAQAAPAKKPTTQKESTTQDNTIAKNKIHTKALELINTFFDKNRLPVKQLPSDMHEEFKARTAALVKACDKKLATRGQNYITNDELQTMIPGVFSEFILRAQRLVLWQWVNTLNEGILAATTSAFPLTPEAAQAFNEMKFLDKLGTTIKR